MELDNPGDALTDINMIRTRAGAVPYTSIDMDKIRNERAMELAFESVETLRAPIGTRMVYNAFVLLVNRLY